MAGHVHFYDPGAVVQDRAGNPYHSWVVQYYADELDVRTVSQKSRNKPIQTPKVSITHPAKQQPKPAVMGNVTKSKVKVDDSSAPGDADGGTESVIDFDEHDDYLLRRLQYYEAAAAKKTSSATEALVKTRTLQNVEITVARGVSKTRKRGAENDETKASTKKAKHTGASQAASSVTMSSLTMADDEDLTFMTSTEAQVIEDWLEDVAPKDTDPALPNHVAHPSTYHGAPEYGH